MESISNAITNGQTNGVVVSGPVGSVPANVVTAGGGVAQGKRLFMCLLRWKCNVYFKACMHIMFDSFNALRNSQYT